MEKYKKDTPAYDPGALESRWQQYWSENKLFVARTDSKKEKKYILVEFPYPSGEGLHMGHLRPYTAGDVTSRYYRANGYETLFPIGWDAFGLPAENFAIKKGVHPRISTEKNIQNAKKQLKSWGMSFDWSREINTTDPRYYRWTQWIFLQFFKAGLAYEATGLINWCPKDKTGLANEEVIDGACERCGTAVEKKELRQWYLRITEYAEKLLKGLDVLTQWPDAVKMQQQHWIGKSEGALIDFRIKNVTQKITVFTTRPDTLYGATYLVLAPEHPLLASLRTPVANIKEVREYIASAGKTSDMERSAASRKKTGVPLKGIVAIHPATKEEIPIWVGDYVLSTYGTGAVMGVPAHDERDLVFAKQYKLPVKIVILPYDVKKVLKRITSAYTGPGTLISSAQFSGMDSQKAKKEIVTFVRGSTTTRYKLRDWVFSRQRYWGEPIPLVHCKRCGVVPIPESDLPVMLPDVEKYEPTGTGESPLAAIHSWVNTTCPACTGPAKRETNTMPQWAGSSWYFLRYLDPQNDTTYAATKSLAYWMPIDIYFGGMEHTTLHLLYSRFWNLFLFDQKYVPVSEPYTRRVPHGIILGPDGEKMSKSRGNVINPNDLVKRYGADTVRMYELFLGPHDMTVSWNEQGMIGIRRFLERLWRLYHAPSFLDESSALHSKDCIRTIHKTIKKVGDDIRTFKFNTAISALMMCLNEMITTVEKNNATLPKKLSEAFLLLCAPFVPHIAEELWNMIGHEDSLTFEPWPLFDPKQSEEEQITIAVQIDGKMRDSFLAPRSLTQEEVFHFALGRDAIKKWIDGREVKKNIYIQDRLLNIVMT